MLRSKLFSGAFSTGTPQSITSSIARSFQPRHYPASPALRNLNSTYSSTPRLTSRSISRYSQSQLQLRLQPSLLSHRSPRILPRVQIWHPRHDRRTITTTATQLLLKHRLFPSTSTFSSSTPSKLARTRPFHTSTPRKNPQRYSRYGYDPHRAQSARPLLTPAQLRTIGTSPSFRAILILSSGAALIFYFTHIETVPVSGRKRFNCFSEASAEAQGELAYREIMSNEGSAGKILPPGDRRVRMVERVLRRLIAGGGLGKGYASERDGEDGEGKGWEVHVIDDPGTANAFVLPGGKVFVYSGILPICRNDDGLAAVLGHEIAHNLAHHSAERMSSMVILQPIVWLFQYLDATGVTLGFGGFLSRMMLDLGVMRPASREQESEADYIGLLLMAQSCYDPVAAVGLWERMEQAQKGAPPEWLSTHPSNTNRIARITEWLPKAEDKREESDCAGVVGTYADDFQRAISRTFVF